MPDNTESWRTAPDKTDLTGPSVETWERPLTQRELDDADAIRSAYQTSALFGRGRGGPRAGDLADIQNSPQLRDVQAPGRRKGPEREQDRDREAGE